MILADWTVKLIEFLEAGRLVGRTRQEVFRHVGGYATPEQIEAELESLLADDRVQRFQVPISKGSKRKMEVWRATTEIRGSSSRTRHRRQ